MRKNYFYLFILTLFVFSCTEDEIGLLEQRGPILESSINEIVFDKLNTHGEFNWDMVDAHTAWSALVNSDKVLSIGYKPEGIDDVHSIIHEIDIHDEEWTAARNQVLDMIEEHLGDDPDFVAEDHIYIKDVLPVVILYTDNYELLKALRANKDLVRYAEPMGYGIEPDQDNNPTSTSGGRDGSGCGLSAASGIASDDYYSLPPYNNIVPWTYSSMGVDAAWSYSTGSNVTVAVFDTGISGNQYKLRGGFDDGDSNHRYISPRSTHYTTTGFWWWKKTTLDSPHDQCGHGTQMTGTVAAPKAPGPSVVGVAYKSNVLAYRVTTDVIINASSEKDGVSDAFVEVAQEGDAKIVSMSLGDLFYNGQVADAIAYAHNSGVLVITAAGTSLTWTSWYGVIFPATMSQTVAVTGVTDEDNYSRCEICHDGNGVDFVVKMERTATRRGLSLNMSGNAPTWTGGSSTGTSHVAGVAALVLSRYPSYSRSDLLNQLKASSQNYPNPNNTFGYGTINALSAVE